MSVQPELGRRLRALRAERGLPLAAVAAATGISRSALSQIETGRSDVTLARLVLLTRFYGRSLVELLPESPGQPLVVRAGESAHMVSAREGVDLAMLAPPAGRTMQPVVLAFEEGSGTREHAPHVGECFAHVLEGTVEIDFDGGGQDERLLLGQGDSAYYVTERRHLLRNAGAGPARLLCVLTPPAF